MPIVFALALAAASARLPAPLLPPVAVRVIVASDIPLPIAVAAMREVDAIWRTAHVQFDWRVGGMPAEGELFVAVGGGRSSFSEDRTLPLAWIDVDAHRAPIPRIYVSFPNVVALLREAHMVPGAIEMMPQAHRDLLLSRAMGRALAHEVGHYLFGSRAHTAHGLMKAVHSAPELFVAERGHFAITSADEARIAALRTSLYSVSWASNSVAQQD